MCAQFPESLSPYPNYFNTLDCRTGTCIDSTAGAANQAATIQIGWVQAISAASFSSTPEFRFWAKCKSGTTCAGISFGVNNPCAVTMSPTFSVSNVWANYTIDMGPILATCPRFNVIRFSLGFNTRNQMLIDDAGFYCGGSVCGAGLPPTPTTAALLLPLSLAVVFAIIFAAL